MVLTAFGTDGLNALDLITQHNRHELFKILLTNASGPKNWQRSLKTKTQ